MPQVNTLVLSRKMMFQKQKKQGTEKRNRFLITVNVVGSAGPLRFVVKEDDPVAGVIESALKAYARGGRVPVLGSDVKNFMLYCANGTSEEQMSLNPDAFTIDSFESSGSNRISWRQKICSVSETVAATDDRRQVRIDAKKGIRLEGMAQ